MQGQLTAPGRRGHLTLVPNVIEPVLDVQAETINQRRAMFRLIAPIAELARTATPEQRPYLRLIVHTMREIADSNTRVAAAARQIAAAADPISNVHEFARTVRPLLAAVSNARTSAELQAANLGELHQVFARTLPRTRSAFSLRPLLGVTRYSDLVEQLTDWEQLQTVEDAR